MSSSGRWVAKLDEQLEFLKKIASRLDAARIPYMLTGSLAMAIYAVPRMTRDIDLVIDCVPGDAGKIARLFEPDCYVDRDQIREAVMSRSMFNIIHNESVIKADFIVRKDEKYRKLEFERRREFKIEGTKISIVAPEDLVLSKLLWSRDTTSELHRRDIRSIMHTVAKLDWRYLEKWAASLGLTAQLEEIRKK